jgi:hypothetical protein
VQASLGSEALGFEPASARDKAQPVMVHEGFALKWRDGIGSKKGEGCGGKAMGGNEKTFTF